MDYVSPFNDGGDTNAGYPDANPATGVEGAIPRGRSLEHPLRELVGVIDKSRIARSGTDLLQVARGVRSQRMNYVPAFAGGIGWGVSGGVLAVSLDPAPTTIADMIGMVLRVDISIGGVAFDQINVNSLGAYPVKTFRGQVPLPGDFPLGSVPCVCFNGLAWVLLTVLYSETPSFLPLGATVYVRPDGSNDNDGQANTPDHAFANMDGVTSFARRFVGANRLAVFVAAGTYPGWVADSLQIGLDIVGTGNPTFAISSLPAGRRGCVEVLRGTDVNMLGVAITSTAASSYGLVASRNALARVKGVDFGAAPLANILAQQSSTVTLAGSIQFTSTASRNAAISADSVSSVVWDEADPPTINITAATLPVSVAFVSSFLAGIVRLNGATFVNGGVVVGKRYLAAEGGIVSSSGGGASFYPGSLAGDATTGFYY
ncbi:hypothetical protein [Chelatococcus reniformis]|uniref:Uncharacterized protein n=1 Tax=Chelatococcus reniformis TaxID=1494448 RepID=A0A916UVQ6_9HYPH|nr:hypothetical protein [Chelatococcus reniformis]GGC90236.1 hypothetical protein GCM10010994_55090 [Chelatococcus reniformis]